MSGGPDYDPKIIERFADQLLRKADSVRVGAAVTGGVLGVVFGAVPLTPAHSIWPVPPGYGVATTLLGALVGILIGWVIGEGRAFRYRVQAQTAIFQLEIERRVKEGVAQAIASSRETATAVDPEPAPPPVTSVPPLPAAPVTPVTPALRPPGAPGPTAPAPEELPPVSPAATG
ncbi:MAG: hypothetical protein WBB74_09845 [Gaiellaceae bacterium]